MRLYKELLHTEIGVEKINKYAVKRGFNKRLKEFQDLVIATQNPFYIYLLADNIVGADKEVLTDEIIKCGDYQYACKMGKFVQGANIEKLTDFIIKSCSPKWIYNFARDVESADKERLSQAMAKTQNSEYIYRFAKNIRGANRKVLCSAIAQLNDASYIISYAKTIPGAEINELFESILRIANSGYVLEFAKSFIDLPQDQIDRATDIMLASGDIQKITLFAEQAQGVNIDKVVNYVISTNKAFDIHYFTIVYGVNVLSKANLDILKNALNKTGEKEYIQSLEEHIELNKEKLTKKKTKKKADVEAE